MTTNKENNIIPNGGTSRTESEVCKRAYESIDPLTRYDPDDNPEAPKSPLYELERFWSDKDKSKIFGIFSKNVIQKYLNINDPFQLLTHNADTKLTKIKLEQAKECIWKKYYAPLRMYNQNGYIDQMSLKLSFEKFIKQFLESRNLNMTNDLISEECSSFLNATDVFAPCTDHCIDITRTGAKKFLTQPRLMQKELTKFDNTLKDMYTYLIKKLEETRYELKKELEYEKVHPKRIRDIIDDKFGGITTVPDARKNDGFKAKPMNWDLSPEAQKKRNKEAEKKRRQKLQNKLIKKVVNEKGELISNYDELFALETPFELTNKGKRISKNTGVLKTKYDRIDKKIELHLRFKANQALKNAQNLLKKKTGQGKTDTKTYEKAELLKELVNKPHTNKPLKLVRVDGKKTTVARGGDKAMRQIISLFGIQEFKDKLDNMKQKYALTEKTEKILDYPKGIFSLRTSAGEKHPTVENFKYFDFKHLEKTVESIFLDYLYVKVRDLQVNTAFDIGKLKTYEKIDIPYVNMYKLEYVGSIYMFVKDKGKFNLKLKIIGDDVMPSPSKSLKYRMNVQAPFVNYDEAVRLARKMVRSDPDTFLRDDNVARFYLRNEDKYRMEPIGNILRVIDLHKPVSKSPSRSRPASPRITYRPATPPPKSASKSKKSLSKSDKYDTINEIANILLAKSPSLSR